jgi:hypothetical protein
MQNTFILHLLCEISKYISYYEQSVSDEILDLFHVIHGFKPVSIVQQFSSQWQMVNITKV